MKLTIIIVFIVSTILLAFRNKINRTNINKLLGNKILLTRLAYVGLAILWISMNPDAERVHIPVLLYVVVPFSVLLMYAIFPIYWIWLLVITTFIIGWSAHMHVSLRFDFAHLGIKTDALFIVFQTFIYLMIFVVCAGVLYLIGPRNIKKHIQKERKEYLTLIMPPDVKGNNRP